MIHDIYMVVDISGGGGWGVRNYIWQRVLEVSEYMARTGATVRSAAAVFGVSKSTVHKDVTDRLLEIDADLAAEVREVLEKNKAERHIRGGEATKRKYAMQREGSAGDS